MRQIVLENGEGHVLRAFRWDGEPVQVIWREDTRRLELVRDTESLALDKIAFRLVGDYDFRDGVAVTVAPGMRLRAVERIEHLAPEGDRHAERDRGWLLSLGLVALVAAGGLAWLLTRPARLASPEAPKQEVIKIVRRTAAVPLVRSTIGVKRSGALSVLGALSGGRAGGLDIAAANATAGPGLGGQAGSGGTQTSLYAKGLTAAPLGPGGRVQGAGGYGTKGKGGGQAGYGKMTMVGSIGAMPTGLVQEAIVDTGLDREAIAAVIDRNLGQVRFCYEQGLQTDPSAGGRVAIDFVIGGTGIVRTASIANSSLGSKIVEDCIVMRLKSWKFPLPRGGVDVKVSYPFVLRRAGQG